MTAQQITQKPDGFRPQAGTFLDPVMSILAEKHLTSIGISPVTRDDFGFGECQPAFRAGLESNVKGAGLFGVAGIVGTVECEGT